MKYETVKDKIYPDTWRVEYVSKDGFVEVAIFSGIDAKERAEEYADWKNRSMV